MFLTNSWLNICTVKYQWWIIIFLRLLEKQISMACFFVPGLSNIFQWKAHLLIISDCAKLRASRTFMPYVPHLPTRLTCLRATSRALHTCLPSYLCLLRIFLFYLPCVPSSFFATCWFCLKVNFIYLISPPCEVFRA